MSDPLNYVNLALSRIELAFSLLVHLQFKPKRVIKCNQAHACAHSEPIFVPNVLILLSAGRNQNGQVVKANQTEQGRRLTVLYVCGV